jgi:hypothetical protein
VFRNEPPSGGFFRFRDLFINMITFRSIFDKLVEELKPEKGHMEGIKNTIGIDDIVDWDMVDVDKFKEFLDGSEIGYKSAHDYPYNIYQSIKLGAPEAYYWLWMHKPGSAKMTPLLKKENYVLYIVKSGYGDYINHVLVDEGGGQILGMIKARPKSSYKQYFNIAPWEVGLSEMVPSVRGGGEGKIMYLMFLEARKAILSDSTLYEGSFAMWDTQIRAMAKYSGVILDGGFPIVNKDTSVYDMAIPNRVLDKFFASNTIAPWIVKYSNKLNSLPAKECFYIQVVSKKYNENSFYEVLDALAEGADQKTIVGVLKGSVRGKSRGRLDPDVNKFIRLADEDWEYDTWSQSDRLTSAKHIIVQLNADASKPPIAIYDIDMSLPEPEVKIL